MPQETKPNRQARRAAKAARRTSRPGFRQVNNRAPARTLAQTRGGRPKLFPGRTGGR